MISQSQNQPMFATSKHPVRNIRFSNLLMFAQTKGLLAGLDLFYFCAMVSERMAQGRLS